MSFLATEVIQAAKDHARARYPLESCGLVVDGKYLPAENIAKSPDLHEEGNRNCDCQLCSFEIDPKLYIEHADKLEAILHSHPNGPLFPSRADMESQLQTGVPWGIVPLDEDRIGEPIMWGAGVPIPPIIGRDFMHGVTDCYSLVRDTFALGREELAKQDIDWPFEPIHLPEVPRDDGWWNQEDQDLYTVGIKNNSFRQINIAEVKPGDGFLMKIKSTKFNHAGLLLPNNLILHHLPTRLSGREPAGVWGRAAEIWVRYEGSGA